MIKRHSYLILLLLFVVCEGLFGEINLKKQQCKIEFINHPTSIELKAIELLNKEVRLCTGDEIFSTDIKSPKIILTVGIVKSSSEVPESLAINRELSDLSEEGFYLNTKPDENQKIYIITKSSTGLMAGIGKFLRLCDYDDNYVEIPEVKLVSSPKRPICGMYFATHFYNFHHVAPIEKVDDVIEDIALYGCNSFAVWFDMADFDSISDPKAKELLARLNHFGQMAHSFGMKFGIVAIANEGYKSTPKNLRVGEGIYGTSGFEICPSKPGGMDLIIKNKEELLKSFSEKIDFTWCWPHDHGGCACEKCALWGGNGFLRCSEQYAKMYKEKNPEGQIWIATWGLNSPGFEGEFESLFEYISENKPKWLHGFLGLGCLRKTKVDFDVRKYPIADFPEISMFNVLPWVGWGANPHPERLIKLFNRRGKEHIVGGWAYSEGIHEDINKFIWLQFCWDPDRKVNDILEEYASFYFSNDHKEEIVKMINLMESSSTRCDWAIANLDNAEKTWEIAKKVDAQLPEWARRSWRWRLLYLRAKIDYIVFKNGCLDGNANNKLKKCFKEIDEMYYVKPESHHAVRSPKLLTEDKGFLSLNKNNLALNRPIKASSVHPELSSRADQLLVNGILQKRRDRFPIFWCNNPAKDKTPSITIDLEKIEEVDLVRIRFRSSAGKYFCTPCNLTISLSDKGDKFEKALSTSDVPTEGTKYTKTKLFWEYPIKKGGRFVKIILGPSQIQEGRYAGMVGLCQIQVVKP